VRPAVRDRGDTALQATGSVSRIGAGRIHVPYAQRGLLESARGVGEPGGRDRFTVEFLVGQRLESWVADARPGSGAADGPPANHSGEFR
jgi:hypothetical protein